MKYGYARISRSTQNIDRQIRNILSYDKDAKIYREAYTGTKVVGRKEFNKLLAVLVTGDTVIFDSVSRMSRNAEEGFELYMDLYAKGITLVFIKEPHINTDSYKKALDGISTVDVHSGHSATDKMINSIMDAVNEFMKAKVADDIRLAFEQAEKEVTDLHERTREGIETARRAGKQIGQPKGAKLTTKKSIEAKEKIKKYNKSFGGSLNDIETMKLTGISRVTFYKYKGELLQAEAE